MTVLAACTGSSVRIQAQQDPNTDLTRYTTYGWSSRAGSIVQRDDGVPQNPWRSEASRSSEQAVEWRIQSEIATQLDRRGYVLASSGRPDLVVSFRVITRDVTLDDAPGQYAHYRAEGGSASWSDTWVGGYEEGTLVVAIANAATGRALWQGSATAVVNPKLRDERIPDAIARMFAQFPTSARR